MRLISVVVILAIVGGIAYVLFLRPDLVSKAKQEGEKAIQGLAGYTEAKTPREAMDQFLKAVKARDYKAAARYSTSEYADKLQRAHAACRALGQEIDSVASYVDEKGYKSDKCTQLLYILDPFPPYLKIADVKEIKGKQVGAFLFEEPRVTESIYRLDELRSVDPKLLLYSHALGQPAVMGALEIRSEGDGDSKVWKIDFKVPQPVHDGIEFYMSHYKAYAAGLDTFRGEIRQGRFLKDKVAPELLQVLVSAK